MNTSKPMVSDTDKIGPLDSCSETTECDRQPATQKSGTSITWETDRQRGDA
jgi:hypothetical protein